LELHGCPIDPGQLIEVISAFLHHRRPNLPGYSQCVECKRAGTICVMVARGIPCLGPVTRAGCGNLCPPLDRGCYGCFGPMEASQTRSLADWFAGHDVPLAAIRDLFRTFNAAAEPFRQESEARDRR
jgi:coenzyme F420-reducing hydrogenase gamma subunit